MRELTVQELLDNTRESLFLTMLAGKNGLNRTLKSTEINRPGLALTGFVELFTYDRLQLFGNTEILYFSHLSKKLRRESFEIICQFNVPCIVFTSNNKPHEELIKCCESRNIPLIVTKLPTTQFINLLFYYTENYFAPEKVIHGTLVDVYGMGLFFSGKSGIGKSEIALDLIERGHRLIADDIVRVKRRSRGVLVGRADRLTQSLLEIRGIGIVDVREMFGVRALRSQKRIEVVVNLMQWEDVEDYSRTGLEESITTILDVDIPQVTIPIFPGKYIAVIVEAVALNHLLKIRGFDAAKELDKNLRETLIIKSRMRKDNKNREKTS